jgi:hypothetical protein
MSRRDLEELLERIEDTREIVLGPYAVEDHRDGDPLADLHAIWTDARYVAQQAYDFWRANPGAEAYAVYRAAADREDAAAAGLMHAERPAAA